MRRSYFLVVLCACAGCGFARTESDEFAAPAARLPLDTPRISEIVITDVSELPKHVGKIVTLKGVQSRTKMPHVVGVWVDGDYSLSDRIAFATGRLSSHETTEEAAKAYNKRMAESPFTGPRLTAGTSFAITDPKTGEKPRTFLWEDRSK